MSDIKLIEELDRTTSLSDNDLLMTSVNNGNGYVSKKMTLGALADYVNSKSGNSGFGGYEMYDLSAEEGDGTFSSPEDYSNSSKNYAWYLEIPAPTSLFQKTVTKDCVVFIDGVGGQDDGIYNWNVYVDNNKIWTLGFRNDSGERKFYIKRGQTLKIDTTTYSIKLSVIPLLSGGEFFFDTTKSELFETGTVSQLSDYQFQASCPTLFVHAMSPNISNELSSKINGKRIVSINNGSSENCAWFILNTNDVLTVALHQDNYNAYANTAKWASYPLLVN